MMADNVTQVGGRGVFKGSDEQLCNSIDALLDLNAKGAVSHRVPGMAVTLLEAAADRIAATRPAPKADSALVARLRDQVEMEDECCQFSGDGFGGGNIFREAADEIERLAALSDRDVVLEEAGFDYVIPQGSTYDEWREHVRQTALYQRGDTVLVWVNQADLGPTRALKGGADE